MDLSILFKRAGKVAAENSPAILTAIGVTGTLTTAYLAARGAFQAVDALEEAAEVKKAEFLGEALNEVAEAPETEGIALLSPEPLTNWEMFEATWKFYIPAAASAALTVAAIVCAASVQDRRNAALISAYTAVDKGFQEYRSKAADRLGVKKDKEIVDEIAQDAVTKNPPTQHEIMLVSEGNVLCRDMYSGRYFNSDMESIRKTDNDINWAILNEGYASLTDYWDKLGISGTTDSDELGWNHDVRFELEITTTMSENNRPCIAVAFRRAPVPRYYRNTH
jgi:hypothetical protein